MAVAPEVIGAGQFLVAIIAILFFKPLYENRETTGAREFAVCITGVVIWTVALALGNFTSHLGASVAVFKIVLLGVEVAAVGWFLTAMSVVRGKTVPRRIVWALVVWIVAIQALIWTNPVHHLVMAPEYTLEGAVLVPEYRLGFWVHTVVSYLIVLLGTGWLGLESFRSSGLRRKQMALLALAALPLAIANVVTLSGQVFAPYDVSPFGYLVSALVIVLVLFEGQFLNISTVARRTAMGEMEDAVITLDDQDRVIDANKAALDLFDVTDNYSGMPALDFFEPISEDIRQRFAEIGEVETEVTVTIDDEQRHFSVSVSPVGRNAANGRIFVLREITEQKRREQELRMLKQVFSRVFRHNVRNELTLIQGKLDSIEEHTENETVRENTAAASESSKRLLSHTEKAREIETVLDKCPTSSEHSLRQLVEDSISTYRQENPSATFRVDVDDVTVQVIEGFETAIGNVVENAVEHNRDSVVIDIWTTVNEDTVELIIEDDGAGISPNEVTPLEENEETALSHSSGVGLWLIKWYVDRSGGSLKITGGVDGTRVKMTLRHVF